MKLQDSTIFTARVASLLLAASAMVIGAIAAGFGMRLPMYFSFPVFMLGSALLGVTVGWILSKRRYPNLEFTFSSRQDR